MVSDKYINTCWKRKHLHVFEGLFPGQFEQDVCFLRGWRCIRKCPASGWASPTSPCPSSPSSGRPPTPGEAWPDITRDKHTHTHTRADKKMKRSTTNFFWNFALMPSLDLGVRFHAATAPCWLLMVQEHFLFSSAEPQRRNTRLIQSQKQNRLGGRS